MQKTLSLIIAAAIIYSLVQTKWHPSSEPIEENTKTENSKVENTAAAQASLKSNNDISSALSHDRQELTGNFLEKSISKIIINSLKTEQGRVFFENLLQRQNRDVASHDIIEVKQDIVGSLFKINSFGKEDLRSATCGQQVTIKYQILDTNNNLISDDTTTFVLGTKPIIPAIDIITVGMSVGQSRQAIVPAQYAYYNPPYRKENLDNGASYRVNLVLNAIDSNNVIDYNEVKIFDDKISYKMPLLCGDKVKFNAKIIRLANGQILYDSQKNIHKVGKDNNPTIEMTIGDVNYPLIVSHALHGKVPVGTRTVIAKGKTFKAIGAKINQMLNQDKIPMDEYLMLELTDFKTD